MLASVRPQESDWLRHLSDSRASSHLCGLLHLRLHPWRGFRNAAPFRKMGLTQSRGSNGTNGRIGSLADVAADVA
jgi:hypothetical protein